MTPSIFARLRLVWLTARRAGVRRSAARLRRIFLLRVVYPRWAARLYPLREIPLPENVFTPDLPAVPEWRGEICLLNTPPFPMRPPVAWGANPLGHTLWAFRLHEWEWAEPLLAQANREQDAQTQLVALLQDYWSAVSVGHPTAYEPYPLSRRLVVWTSAWRILNAQGADKALLARFAAELDRGARMLADNLEHDLDNNHVIANARALVEVGTLFQQPYANTGFALMWEQLRAQVRSDGGHVENSTSYQLGVLQDAEATCALANEYRIPIPTDIPSRLDAMRDLLAALRYPDGSFPLLNDSVQDGLDKFDATDSAPNTPLTLFPETGYAVVRANDLHLVFDAGALGPAYCPGHGHADTLSFTLWAKGHARLIDPGVYQYQAGAARDEFRGTAAHNTLRVDGLDSSEVSGSFRVGRMAKAQLYIERAEMPVRVRGEHDGYARLIQPIWHTRTLELGDAQTVRLTDEIRGSGTHTYELYFHFAPNATLQLTDGSAIVTFQDGVTLTFEISGAPAVFQTAMGWDSPTWYTKIPAPILKLEWRGAPPYEIKTNIRIGRWS